MKRFFQWEIEPAMIIIGRGNSSIVQQRGPFRGFGRRLEFERMKEEEMKKMIWI